MTKPNDDDDAQDLHLDRLLAEELGGERLPDLVDRIARADAAAMARAAAQVDAAEAEAMVDAGAGAGTSAGTEALPPWRRWPGLVLAAVVLLGVAGALLWSNGGDGMRLPPPRNDHQALLDDFHRVMPVEPPALRDPLRRQRLRPAALPVLRELIALLAAHPDEVPWRDRAPEFTIYALVLADAATFARVEQAAGKGDVGAQVLLAAAAAITATGERERTAALDGVAQHLRGASDEARSAVHCLLTAADLSAAEALRLAAATTDEGLAQRLRIGAELADGDSRRLLGKPFELAGRLHTGAEFSTASLRGKVVLVFFWASWCQPCTHALPAIVDAAHRYASRGLEVVGVSCDHDRDDLTKFLAAHPEVSWPQLFDVGQPGWHELAFWSGVRSVPRVFLVDRRGFLREIHTRDDLDGLIKKLLAE